MPDGLFHKIEAFVRKFYLNRLVQGVLVGAVLWMVFFLLINGLEYFSWFPPKGRFVLFLFLMLGSAFVLVYHFLIPLVNLMRFRKKMSVEQAASLIGKFFPDIQDKLLNTIQLSDELKKGSDNQLLGATIEQRTAKLSPIRFSDAVDLRANLKYLGIFFGLLAVVLLLVVFFPKFAVQPTQRIVNYGQSYEKPLPYHVEIQSYVLETNQGADLKFNIVVTGERIPDAFFVKSELGQQLMTKNTTNDFSFTFKNLYDDIDFQVIGGDFSSRPIHVSVHPTPTLLSYRAELRFPDYIHRENEIVEAKTRLIVPQGTRLRFIFLTRDAQHVFVDCDSLSNELVMDGDCSVYQFVASSSMKFSVRIENDWNATVDPMSFTVDVIPDTYPDIHLESFDEQLSSDVFFSGLATDDYGFSKLTFNCRVKQPAERSVVLPVAFDGQQTRTSFFYHFNMDSLGLLPGQDMEVFFEIWDNDGFHGPKSKRSATFTYNKPSEAALDSIADHSAEDIAERLERKSEEAKNLQDDIEKMLQDLIQKKELDWSDKEKMKDIIEKQNEIQEEWNQLQKEQQQLSEFMKEHEIANEELLKKQEQINKLFEEVIPDEMKKMMDELQKLLDEMPREQMQQLMHDIKKNNQSMQEMLDRNLNLLEQLKMEKDITDFAEKLNELGEELNGESQKETGEKSAQEAQEAFREMMDELDKMMEKNQSLANPLDLEKDEAMENEINDDLEQAGESEQSGDQNKSQQKKQSAGKKMQQMANGLMLQMQGSGMEQLAEDAHLMRVLLENVVHASHEQEQLMLLIGSMRTDDPSLAERIIRQKEIAGNFDMVRDSLHAMAMRQPAVQNFIFEELHVIENQTNLTMKYLNDLSLSLAVRNQQTAMMAMNNLALMLAESLEQMENSMESDGMPMNGSKPKPGKKSGSQSMQQMQQMQQQLGEQLKQMQQQLKKGQQQGGMSEELARMAAEQEMLRQGMQQLIDEMKKNGQIGDDGLNEIIKDMERLEEDLVNKRVTRQTLQRNQEIISRMLESQKAQEKRDQEEKRKSNEYKGSKFERVVDELFYEQQRKKNQEFLKMQPIEFTPYYKTKINSYYLKKNTQTE